MHGLAAFCIVLVLQAPQGRSMLDAARRNGGTSTSVIAIDSGVPSFTSLIADSVVILRGTVRRVTTRLSDDQERVMTQFEITPLKVYKGSIATVVQTPGPTRPLIVERVGGEVSIDGLQMKTIVDVFPETESLRDGEDVFLFLSPGTANGLYRLTDGPFGAYRIVDGQVTAMTKESAARRREQPEAFAAFEHRVVGLISK